MERDDERQRGLEDWTRPAACIPARRLGAGTSRREVGGRRGGRAALCPAAGPRYVGNANGMLEWTASEPGAGIALAAICCEPRRRIATASQEWGCFFFFFFYKEILPCPLPCSCMCILINRRERGWDSCGRVMRAKGEKGPLELSLYLVWGGIFLLSCDIIGTWADVCNLSLIAKISFYSNQ